MFCLGEVYSMDFRKLLVVLVVLSTYAACADVDVANPLANKQVSISPLTQKISAKERRKIYKDLKNLKKEEDKIYYKPLDQAAKEKALLTKNRKKIFTSSGPVKPEEADVRINQNYNSKVNNIKQGTRTRRIEIIKSISENENKLDGLTKHSAATDKGNNTYRRFLANKVRRNLGQETKQSNLDYVKIGKKQIDRLDSQNNEREKRVNKNDSLFAKFDQKNQLAAMELDKKVAETIGVGKTVNRNQVEKMVKEQGLSPSLVDYTMNKYKLKKLPSRESVNKAKYNLKSDLDSKQTDLKDYRNKKTRYKLAKKLKLKKMKKLMKSRRKKRRDNIKNKKR
jgi:hypothetical protein